jgi:hypothetical protein
MRVRNHIRQTSVLMTPIIAANLQSDPASTEGSLRLRGRPHNTLATSSPTVGHRNCPKNLRLSKHTDMTIHWKAIEEHFLIVYTISIHPFSGENPFSEFYPKILSPLELNVESSTVSHNPSLARVAMRLRSSIPCHA